MRWPRLPVVPTLKGWANKNWRRVVIEPFPQRIDSEIGPLFKSLVPAMDDLCAGYNSRDLAPIRDFIAGVHQVFYDQIQRLREGAATPGPPSIQDQLHRRDRTPHGRRCPFNYFRAKPGEF